MFLRCERCRAVYEVDAGASAEPPIVACLRCAHVFVARFGLTSIAPVGVLGGAAALPAPEPVQRAWAPPAQQPRSISMREAEAERARVKRNAPALVPAAPGAPVKKHVPWIAFALAVLAFAGAAVWIARHRRGGSVDAELPPALVAKLNAAEATLLLDDAASLERAIAEYDQAATLAPNHPRLKALVGFATLLAGASLKAEASDLELELAQLDRERRRVLEVEPVDEAKRSQLAERMADVRARISPATTRAEKLIRSGLETVRAVAALEGYGSQRDVVRALALFYAASQDPEKVESAIRVLGDEVEDPWLEYARGYARTLGSISPKKAREAQQHLESALGPNPKLIRAKWDLARVALAMNPPQLDRAESLLTEVAFTNPAHEGAQRGLELIKQLRAFGAPPPAAAPAPGPEAAIGPQ